jgi:hypothetical protein
LSEPIDAVYTWVDGADPHWSVRMREKLESLGSEAGSLHSSSTSDSRFKNRDELRWSVRSLERYAPFVRKVYLVTDSQRPSWLATGNGHIEVVDHRGIFPCPDDLPTFNSRAIECHLHRIEGLSERFIYVNDDILLCAETTASDYFDAEGKPLVYLDRREVVWDPDDRTYDRPINSAVRNSSLLLESLGYDRIQHRIDHVPYALRRSVLQELWELFPSELEQTSSHPFRDPQDVKLTSALFQYFTLARGEAVAIEEPSSSYIKIQERPLASLRLLADLWLHRRAKDAGVKFFSLNDAGTLSSSKIVDRTIDTYLGRAYPVRSRFEREG